MPTSVSAGKNSLASHCVTSLLTPVCIAIEHARAVVAQKAAGNGEACALHLR